MTCVTEQHNIWLVCLAAIVCVVAATAALNFHERSCESEGLARWLWIALTALISGSGVWATHMIGMLAYSTAFSVVYDLWLTTLSLGVAIIGVGAGFALAAQLRSPGGMLLGGTCVGLGIAAMHFVGIAGVRSPFGIEWNLPFVVASVAIAAAGGVAALYCTTLLSGWKQRIIAPAFLVLGICGLHFTAMTAMIVVPDLAGDHIGEVVTGTALAVMTAGVVVLVIFAAVALSLMEVQTREGGLRAFRSVFHAAPAGLAHFDGADRLILWNKAFFDLAGPFGVTLRSGISCESMTRKTVFAAPVGRARLNTNPDIDDAVELQSHGGSWVRLRTRHLPEGGMVLSINDITELKNAATELMKSRDQAESANQAKSDFLANMSHEIRTPLNGILGMAQVMMSDRLSKTQRSRVSIIRESGDALLKILNDILDLSKVQSGKLDLNVAPFDIGDLALTIVHAFQGAAAVKGVELVADIDQAIPKIWLGDELRLRQVLSNLIGNAIKFTASGSVRLETEGDETGLRFRVRDTGIGIDEKHHRSLFDKFSQADASTSRRYGGTGLGLAISRDLVEQMGGRIDVSSQPGIGSCFTVTLPLTAGAIDSNTDQPTAPDQQPAAPSAELRILAAEDNPTNQLVLRSLLAPLGVELTLVANGREAVDAFCNQRFDIILMDIQMPEMNGVEATSTIRRFEERQGRHRTPIVALTANVMPHQIDDYLLAGMDGVVGKPIDLTDLYSKIEQALVEQEPVSMDLARTGAS
jgi:signal transduction histidine kinase/NO-binding membrane sensor protein with MHYT domain